MRCKTMLPVSGAFAWMLRAQPALGATAWLSSFNGEPRINYEAALGEINDVNIVEAPDGVYMITDLNAAITAQAGCMSITPNTVRCEVGPGNPDGSGRDDRASVFTKDGADRVYIDSHGAFVHGGSGPDTLTGTVPSGGQFFVGGSGDDHLIGGAGTQMLFGGEGADSLEGGAGDDELGGGPGTDVVTGGPGSDLVDYADHTTRVRISLDGLANDGAAGENDWLREVESAYGSRGPTTFIGDASPNQFWSFSDDGDVVQTGAGNDFVDGGDGPDVVSGGDGDDQVNGQGGRDVVRGGAGDDYLSGGGRADALRGGPGNDFVNGRTGADELSGGTGKDRLSGGPQNDILRGGPGRDRLLGDSGADVFDARDRNRERVDGGLGVDRARVDPIDSLFSVEVLF
jgi:Ca2+-binding RTX toxin-like protein